MTWYKPRWWVFGIAVVAHLIIIGGDFWVDAYPENSYDEARYVFYGESIRAGRGMHAPGYEDKPTAYVMPTLPLMIAAIGTESLIPLRIVQLILGGLVAVLVFHLGQTITKQDQIGWLGVFFLMANLAWMQQPLYVLTEPLFIVLLLLATYFMIDRPERWQHMIGIGVTLGLAWLTRGALIGPLMTIYPYLWWRLGFKKMVIVGLVMSAVIMPWIVRNYFAFDTFVATSTQSGNVLAGAYNDIVYENPWGDGWINPDQIYREQVSEALFNDELAYANYQYERGVEWIQNNPEKLPKLFAAHFLGFVRPWFKVARNDIEFLYVFATWFITVPLILYGSWYAVKNRIEAFVLMLLIIGGGFITGIFLFAIPRYRLPFIPYFALLQALAVWQLWLRFPKTRSDTAAAE